MLATHRNREPKSLGWWWLEHGFCYLISTTEWRSKMTSCSAMINHYQLPSIWSSLALVFCKNFHKYLKAVFLHTSTVAFFTNKGCSREKRLFSSIFRNQQFLSTSIEKMSSTQLLAKSVENAHWQNDTRLTEERKPFLGYPNCFGSEMQ